MEQDILICLKALFDIEFLNETELRDDSIVFKLDNNKNLKIQVEEVGEEYEK